MKGHTRRHFLQSSVTLIGASSLAGCGAPLFERQPAQPSRVGILSFRMSADSAPLLEAFRGGLRDLGYVEGQTIVLEPRFTEGQAARYPELAAELVRLGVAAIVAPEPGAIRAAWGASDTVPIVMAGASEIPVERGLIDSLARPGRNVTGLAYGTPGLPAKRLQFLTDTVPGLSGVAFIGGEPERVEDNPKVGGVAAAARALGLALELVSLRTPTPPDFAPRDVAAVFEDLARMQVGAFVMDSSALAFNNRARVSELAIQHRLPSIWGGSQFKDAALLTYGANNLDVWRRTATHVDKLLKGASPADLPVELPTRFDFTINLQIARALGLTIPDPLLRQATEIVQ